MGADVSSSPSVNKQTEMLFHYRGLVIFLALDCFLNSVTRKARDSRKREASFCLAVLALISQLLALTSSMTPRELKRTQKFARTRISLLEIVAAGQNGRGGREALRCTGSGQRSFLPYTLNSYQLNTHLSVVEAVQLFTWKVHLEHASQTFRSRPTYDLLTALCSFGFYTSN